MKYCILSEHAITSHPTWRAAEPTTEETRTEATLPQPDQTHDTAARTCHTSGRADTASSAFASTHPSIGPAVSLATVVRGSALDSRSGAGLQNLSAPLAEICVVCQDQPVAVALDCGHEFCGHEFCGHCPAGWQGYCQSLPCPLCRQPSRSQTLLAGVDPDDVLPLRRLSQTPPPPPGDETFPTAFSDENWEAEVQAQPLRPVRGDSVEWKHPDTRWRTLDGGWMQCLLCCAHVRYAAMRRHDNRCQRWRHRVVQLRWDF